MNRQIIKKMILCLMTVILCVTTCAPAFASKGDRTLMHFSDEEQANDCYINSAFRMGDGFCIYYREGSMNPKQIILRYADAKAEPEKFILQDDMSAGEGDIVSVETEPATETDLPAAEDAAAVEGIAAGSVIPEGEEVPAGDGLIADEGFIAGEGIPEGEELTAGTEEYIDYSNMSYTYEYVNSVFAWKDDLYAVVTKTEYNGDESKQNLFVKHLRLEDGKAVPEDCDVPELDITSLMHDSDYGDGGSYFGGFNDPFMVGDTLVGTSYGDEGSILVAFDLTTGFCSEFAVEEPNGITAGPDGSVLINHYEYDDSDYSSKAAVIRINLEDQSEETILELTGSDVYNVNLCYDQEKDVLYYTLNGELWAAPQMDKDQAFSVNECPEAGNGAICLKDGFLLIWTNNTALIRNTDPSQRSSITLRVDIDGWNTAATNAVYAMSEVRGDVAVLLKGIEDENFDMMQAMMNRDSYMDIYNLYCSGSDYNALKNRGFLQDLSDNEQIAADTERMYPIIRDFVKQDGKIIGVPLYVSAGTLGINTRLWKNMGGTEEELPKTWDQFFDWLETLPEKLTEDIDLVEDSEWMDRDNFRSSIRSDILDQYQVMMDARGEEDYVFNTPMINSLLKRLEEVDYDALGVREADESREDNVYDMDMDKKTLLATYFINTPGSYNSTIYAPLILTFEEGEEPIIPTYTSLAILNPYSEHPEEAKLYLSLMLQNEDASNAYTLFTDKTEPIANSYYLESKKYYDENVAFLQEQIEKADGDEKATWEGYLRETEDQMEDMERWGWVISPQSIENYKTTNTLMKMMTHDFMVDILGSVDEEAEEAFYNELDRERDVDKYLNTIDNKLQMVRREGH